VLPWKRQQRVPRAVRSSYETFRTASTTPVKLPDISTTPVKLPDISDDFRQILNFWKVLR
jgi:hypothetical protein